MERLADTVCRRAFSSPEAWLYELTIARALSNALAPTFEQHVVGSRVLDVGAGGGTLDALIIEELKIEIVALDPSLAQVRRARRRARRDPLLSVEMGSAERIPSMTQPSTA
jgi:ubiquinone/menaquinone biosynthesis C-methylase UbiE